MKTKEEILDGYKPMLREWHHLIKDRNATEEEFVNDLIHRLDLIITQTREEIIREVGNSIKSFFYSLDDTNDEPFNKGIIQIDLDLVDKQIKDILNKLKK